jgi:AcrR family transcriptional regulator
MARARDGAPLSREVVLRAALRIIDERGARGLTMRALGAELGVEAMSVYRHVPGKRAVEDGVVELMLDELSARLAAVPAEPDGWRAAIELFARAFHGVAVDHPSAFRLFAERPARGWIAAREGTEASLALLCDAGFDAVTAVAALRTVIRYVIGFSLAQVAGEADRGTPAPGEGLAEGGFPLVATLVRALADERDETLFEFGLATLLDGLEARLAAAPGISPVDRARAPG